MARGRRAAPPAAPRRRGTANHAAHVELGGHRHRDGAGRLRMTREIVRVGAGWLRLREGADARARAAELVGPLRARLPPARPATVHDLACGTGSMGRWLAPLLPGPARWVLHDRDPDLLEAARHSSPAPVETREGDITRLEPDDLAGADLITASALVDLLDAAELEAVVGVCASAACP